MDVRGLMLERIEGLGLDIERLKSDILGLEEQIDAIMERLDIMQGYGEDLDFLINMGGRKVWDEGKEDG